MKTLFFNGGYWWLTTTCQTSSNETWITLAPNRFIASSFVVGALSGTIVVHSIPRSRACQARACAMFPALTVYTPLALASGPANAMEFEAPRALKEPVG